MKDVAWQVSEADGEGCIVFEKHNVSARRVGAGNLGLDFEGVECRRAPQYDKYAPDGNVPPKILLEDGWWLECNFCGRYVLDNDALDEVVELGQNVYCNKSCNDAHKKEKEDREQAFSEFKDYVKNKRPDLAYTEFRGGGSYITMTAKFTFPGAKYEGSVIDQSGDGNREWSIARGDVEAWEKYEATRKGVENETV